MYWMNCWDFWNRDCFLDAVKDILAQKDETMHIIMTGGTLPEGLKPYIDSVTCLTTEVINETDTDE